MEPILTRQDLDGSSGDYSKICVCSDSSIADIAGLEGKTLVFADPDSASSYAVLCFNLEQQGILALIFIRAFGLGPLAGVLAIAV